MERSRFEQLKEAAGEQAARYDLIKFPMVFDSASNKVGFNSPSGTPVYFEGLSGDGMTYILYRLGQYVKRHEARDQFAVSRAKFVELINFARAIQEQEHWREIDRTLIAATIKGTLYGILTNYNPVSNREVLDMVDDAKLVNRLTWYKLTPKEMSLYLKSKNVLDNHAAFGMAIRNGETGHVTLGYHLYVSYGDFIFTFPYDNTKRHLSRVNEAKNDMTAALNDIDTIDIDAYLRTHPASEVVGLLRDKKFDKLRSEISRSTTCTINEFIIRLLRHRDSYGWKTLTDEAVSKVLNEVASKVTE